MRACGLGHEQKRQHTTVAGHVEHDLAGDVTPAILFGDDLRLKRRGGRCGEQTLHHLGPGLFPPGRVVVVPAAQPRQRIVHA